MYKDMDWLIFGSGIFFRKKNQNFLGGPARADKYYCTEIYYACG